MTDKSNFSPFDFIFDRWYLKKKEAVESNNFSEYYCFLLFLKKEVSKLYLESNNQVIKSIFREILEIITCEIGESIIKLKKAKEVPF
jgi:hypothetical protein